MQISTAATAGSFVGMQQAIGNRKTRDLLGGEIVQPQLKVGSPDDSFEKEADRMADAVMAQPSTDGDADPSIGLAPGSRAQRMCADCAEEEDETVRPKSLPGGSETRSPVGLQDRLGHLRGRGRPLSPSARSFFEPRFDHDFSDVRVHSGGAAAEAARSIDARAFTVGRDVVFGAGEYEPQSRAGRHLLAHELTHVVQQTPLVRRKAFGRDTSRQSVDRETSAPSAKPNVPRRIVDDDAAEPGPGQMRKSMFLAEVRRAVCGSAEEAFAETEHTTQGCPWIEATLRFYEGQGAERIERDMAGYVPEAAGVTTARDYIPFIAARARRSVETWMETGEVTGLPEGLPGMGLAGALSGSLASGLAGLFFKARPGGPRGDAAPQAVQAQLGEGQPLAGPERSRMESAFGRSFGDVRIHNDAGAARLSDRYNARAFAVGGHVAFGSGEYRPGTPVGDALLAHELAHVEQQSRATRLSSTEPGAGRDRPALEEEANQSSLAAVKSLWADDATSGASGFQSSLPRLRSGLHLQRCPKKQIVKNPTTNKPAGKKSAGKKKSVPKGSGIRYIREPVTLKSPPAKYKVKDFKKELQQKVKQGEITSFRISGIKSGDPEEVYLYNALVRLGIKRNWGTEMDLVTPIGGKTKGRVTVRLDPAGNIEAKLLDKSPPAAPATFKTVKNAKDALIKRYKLAKVKGEKKRAWKLGELNKVFAAWGRLSDAEAAALEGYTLIRTDSISLDGEDLQALTTHTDEVAKGATRSTHVREMRFADSAFNADSKSFIGNTNDAAPASFEILIHEVGHALEAKPFDDLNALAVKASAKANRELAAARAAQLAANAKINAALKKKVLKKEIAAAQPLVTALLAAQRVLQAFEKSPDTAHEKAAEKAIADRDAAKAKIPAGNKAAAGFATALTAQDAYLTALLKLPSTTSAATAAIAKANALKSGSNTKRLQAFVDFVTKHKIPPPTKYAADHWPGEPIEFYSDAFSLWKNDPTYFTNYSPKLKAWFDAGNHMK